MRSLATGKYGATEVAQRLTEDAPIGFVVDITDRYGNVVETLPAGATGDVGVLLDASCSISADFNAPIKSQVRLVMRPYEPMRNRPFAYWLACRGLLGMRDGGFASFSLGRYVVDSITTDVGSSTSGRDEWWSIVAGDGTYLLEQGGPPPAFEAVKGERVSDAVNRVLLRGGIVGRVPKVDVFLEKTFLWSVTKPKTYEQYERLLAHFTGIAQDKTKSVAARRLAATRARSYQRWVSTHVLNTGTVTWLLIANELLGSVGFDDLWFDWDGQPRIGPAKDPTKVGAALTYRASVDGLLTSRLESTPDRARRANQVTVRMLGTATLPPLTVSANTYAPNHPLAPARCGFVIPLVVDVSVAVTQAAQKATAIRELFKALGRHEKKRYETLWHPGHELDDVVAVQEHDQVVALNTGQMSISPIDLGVLHEDDRVYPQ